MANSVWFRNKRTKMEWEISDESKIRDLSNDHDYEIIKGSAEEATAALTTRPGLGEAGVNDGREINPVEAEAKQKGLFDADGDGRPDSGEGSPVPADLSASEEEVRAANEQYLGNEDADADKDDIEDVEDDEPDVVKALKAKAAKNRK